MATGVVRQKAFEFPIRVLQHGRRGDRVEGQRRRKRPSIRVNRCTDSMPLTVSITAKCPWYQ